MTLLLQLTRLNDVIATTLGICANSFLMYLVFTVNQASMKQMSRTLLQNSILDLLLAAVILIGEPQIVVINGIYYNVIGSPLHAWGFKFAGVIIPLFGMTIVLSILAMPIPFYIRYLVLCKNTQVTFKHLVGPYSVVFVYSIALFGAAITCYPPIESVYDSYKPALNNSFWLNEYPKGAIFVAKPPTDPALIVTFSMILLATAFSYMLVIYYSVRITRYLRKSNIEMSSRTRMLNKQLQLTLTVQTIGPLLTGNLPVLVLVIMSLFTLENHYVSLGCCSLLAWVAIINPVAAMVIIKPYRLRIMGLLHIRSNAVATTSGSLSNNPGKYSSKGVTEMRRNDYSDMTPSVHVIDGVL